MWWWYLQRVLLKYLWRVLYRRVETVGYVPGDGSRGGGGRRHEAETGGFWENRAEVLGGVSGGAFRGLRRRRRAIVAIRGGLKVELSLGAVEHNGGTVIGSGGVFGGGESS